MLSQEDLSYVVQVARDAGRLILDHYGRVERLTKTHVAAHNEAVTEADRASQRFIVKALRKRYPADGMIGEESDSGASITFECPDPMGRVWVIDPIDGTNNFIAGLGNFCVCIGLLDKGYPVLGVVYDVCRGEVYSAIQGQGAHRDGKPIHAPQHELDDASMLMLTANLLTREALCPPWAVRWMSQVKWKVRILGTAALEAVQVAAGVAHGAVTVHGKLWDAAAAAAVVLEAGGVMTDLKGQAIFPFDLRDYRGAKVPFLAGGPKAHAQLLSDVIANP